MASFKTTQRRITRENICLAKEWWPGLDKSQLRMLRDLSSGYCLRLARGEVQLLDGRWYVTHSGLLNLAIRRGCIGIEVRPMAEFSDPRESRWAVKAIVYKSGSCRGFAGFGDANPANVSAVVRGAELRIAETRAVNRALRKAYGIGLCSIEEMGSTSGPAEPPAQAKREVKPTVVPANGHGYQLRDRLLVLIRQQSLDGALVKAYAADFCDVKEMRDASREQVQEFINHLSEYAANDREGLLCQLNSYASKKEERAA